MDQWKRTLAAFTALVMTVGGTSGCVEWAPQALVEKQGSGASVDDDHVGDGDFRGAIIARNGLNIRESPSTTSPVVGGLASGVSIRIDCKTNGQNIEGNPRWYRLSEDHWVAARYVTNVGAAPSSCR